jgi:RimJ/RimL family protein N-acetyltransferase
VITDEQRPEYFAYAARVLDQSRPLSHEDGCRVLTRLHADGSIAGVVLYGGFTGDNCEISIASDQSGHWMTREFIRLTFGYPFLQLKLRRITGMVNVNNKAALNFNHRMGFIVEGCLRKWFGDDDAIVFGMLREECRWIKGLKR